MIFTIDRKNVTIITLVGTRAGDESPLSLLCHQLAVIIALFVTLSLYYQLAL